MRKLPALIAAAGLIAVSLTACSTASASACSGGAPAGDASSTVEVGGAVGAVPTVDFPTPLKSNATQASVIRAGHGNPIVKGQMVNVDLAVYNGTSGELIEKTDFTKEGEDTGLARAQHQAGAAGPRQGAHVREGGFPYRRGRSPEGRVRNQGQPPDRHRQG